MKIRLTKSLPSGFARFTDYYDSETEVLADCGSIIAAGQFKPEAICVVKQKSKGGKRVWFIAVSDAARTLKRCNRRKDYVSRKGAPVVHPAMV